MDDDTWRAQIRDGPAHFPSSSWRRGAHQVRVIPEVVQTRAGDAQRAAPGTHPRPARCNDRAAVGIVEEPADCEAEGGRG